MGWPGWEQYAHNEYHGAHFRARSWIDLEGVWESEIGHEFEFESFTISNFSIQFDVVPCRIMTSNMPA